MTDNELRLEGFKILTEKLGIIDAERFIALTLRERFDYTEWHQSLWPNISIEDLSAAAMKFRRDLESKNL